MSGRNARMVEIVGGIVTHPEALHDSHRSHVGRHSEQNDLVQANALEAVRNRSARSLGRESPAPVLARKPPTDFDRRGEMRREVMQREADIADELGFSWYLHRPWPPLPQKETLRMQVQDRVCN